MFQSMNVKVIKVFLVSTLTGLRDYFALLNSTGKISTCESREISGTNLACNQAWNRIRLLEFLRLVVCKADFASSWRALESFNWDMVKDLLMLRRCRWLFVLRTMKNVISITLKILELTRASFAKHRWLSPHDWSSVVNMKISWVRHGKSIHKTFTVHLRSLTAEIGN